MFFHQTFIKQLAVSGSRSFLTPENNRNRMFFFGLESVEIESPEILTES